MIYCSQPRALKSTATGELAREVASEKKDRERQKRVKGEGKEGMAMTRDVQC